jgi:hypothetical protein
MDERAAAAIDSAVNAVRESETTGLIGVRDPDSAVAWASGVVLGLSWVGALTWDEAEALTRIREAAGRET